MTGYTAIVTIIRSWDIFSNFIGIISYTSFPHCVYFTIRVIKRIFIYNLTFEEDSYSKSCSGNHNFDGSIFKGLSFQLSGN